MRISFAVMTGMPDHGYAMSTTLLTRQTLAEHLHRSVPTVDRWRSKGWLPKPVKLPSGAVVWRRETIDNWLRECEGVSDDRPTG